MLSFTFDSHDLQATFNVVCTLLGIGSLGMAYAFAQAGPVFGSISLFIVCGFNIYATVCLSKCFLEVPPYVETFTDLGMWVAGKPGRIAVQVTQLGTCLIVPIAFLILGGGTLLPAIAKDAFDITPTWWILIMAVCLLPVVLIRTLKEAYWVMILGAATAFAADFIAVAQTGTTQTWERYVPTVVETHNIFPVFGTFALSYGAALIVPTVQREHPNPKNMPIVAIVSLVLITTIYFLIAGFGYAQFGCSSPSNLLIAMNDSFWKRLAFVCMQAHITVAFAVVLNPAVFYFERTLFGLQQENPELAEKKAKAAISGLPIVGSASINGRDASPKAEFNKYSDVDQPRLSISGRSPMASLAMVTEADLQVEYSSAQKLQSFVLRVSVVAVQTFLAMLGQGCFMDIADFIGATTVSSCCIILPCAFYLKMFYKRLSVLEKVLCVSIIVSCTVVGVYTAVKRMENIIDKASQYRLFEQIPEKNDDIASYPFCPSNYVEIMTAKGVF